VTYILQTTLALVLLTSETKVQMYADILLTTMINK